MGKVGKLGQPDLASRVIHRYLTEAEGRLSEWQANYAEKIRAYLATPEKQRWAITRLRHYYEAMEEVDLPTEYRRIMSTVLARKRGKDKLVAPPAVVPAPAPIVV